MMLPIAVPQNDAREVLAPCGLAQAEVDDLREWLCHIKPIGPGIRMKVTPASGGDGSCIVTAGNEPGPVREIRYSGAFGG